MDPLCYLAMLDVAAPLIIVSVYQKKVDSSYA